MQEIPYIGPPKKRRPSPGAVILGLVVLSWAIAIGFVWVLGLVFSQAAW